MTENAGPSEVEQAIGARLKLLRKIKRLTQKDLAKLLDVKFQQVQKYENGTNRISASRLQQLAQALNVNWSFFFPTVVEVEGLGHLTPGMSDHDQAQIGNSGVDENAAREVFRFLETNDGIRLNVAFSQIKDFEQRKSIITMAETLAKTS